MKINTKTLTRLTVTAVAAATVLAASACSASSRPPAAAGSPSLLNTTSTAVIGISNPVLATSVRSMPGGTTMALPAAPAGPHNQADVAFAQQMTVHHEGAIAMADLAPTRGASSAITALAARIKAAQVPEIAEMKSWLAAWAPTTDMNGMPMSTAHGTAMSTAMSTEMSTAMSAAMSAGSGGMGGMGGSAAMPGMMTDQQMSQLTAASGAAFDKLFLQLMTIHHQGALAMAKTEKTDGTNPAALALANSITASQTAQIAEMQAMLKGM